MTRLLIIVGLAPLIFACSGNRTEEIGGTALASPEESQRYLTINEAFSRHDTNGDGYIDQHEYGQLQGDAVVIRIQKAMTEIQKSGPLLFEEIDDNDDGYITLNELTVIVQPLLPDTH